VRIALLSTSDTDLLSARASGAPYAWEYGVELVAVPDPQRERGGTAAFLVWGDPSLYDSTSRVGVVLGELTAARVRAGEAAGWVMDACLLGAVD
jgi:hypothetical protein